MRYFFSFRKWFYYGGRNASSHRSSQQQRNGKTEGGKLLIPIQNQPKTNAEADQNGKDELKERDDGKKDEKNDEKVDKRDDEYEEIMVRDVATQTPPLRGNDLKVKSVEKYNLNLQKFNNGAKETPIEPKINLIESDDEFNFSDSRKVIEEIEAKFEKY